MKNIFNSFLVIYLLVFIGACQKEKYPADIPQWLKDKIEYCGKKGNCCDGNTPLRISEYQDPATGQTIYLFKKYVNPTGYDLYDANGDLQCYLEVGQYYSPCGNYIFGSCIYVREIWTQSEKNCK